MTDTKIITVAGRRTRVRVEGDPAHPPVVLLHGITRSLNDWDPQWPLLSPHFRVIAMDLPGFAYSERKPEPATLAALADGVVETLDELGEQRPVHVIGNSLGGATTLQLVATHPERVRSLVLVNPAGFGHKVTWGLRSQNIPIVGPFSVRHPNRMGAWVSERIVIADRKLVTPDGVTQGLTVARQPGVAEFQLEMIRYLGTVRRGIRPEWRRDLLAAAAKHPRPMLIIWGDKDKVLPVHQFDNARQAFPDAQRHLFTGYGHMPQRECPREFADLVLDFLNTVDVSPDDGTPV